MSRSKNFITSLLVTLSISGCATQGPDKTPEETIVTIGTGGVAGVYHPTGEAICRIVNLSGRKHGVRCTVEITRGSIDNANALRDGNIEFGMMQSNWQYHALHGTTSFFRNRGPFKELRAVFSLYAEPLTILARQDAGIRNVHDLAGKRVDIGKFNTTTNKFWKLMWKEMGKTFEDLQFDERMERTEALDALCDGSIDAMVWLVGHPNQLTWDATRSCNAVLVESVGPAITNLINDNPFFRMTTIPGGMYREHPNDTAVFGVGATLVTSASTSEDAVYQLVRAIFENFDKFKKLHPTLAYLESSEMIRDSLSAPLHEGAARYYREQGWM